MFPPHGSDCPPTLSLIGKISFFPCQVSRSLHTCMTADKSFVICLVSSCHRSRSLSQGRPVDQAAAASIREASIANLNTLGTAQPWIMNDFTNLSETQLLEEQMLRAGILASLRDAPNNDAKVEVPKSSVSSLRLVIINQTPVKNDITQTNVICYKIFKQQSKIGKISQHSFITRQFEVCLKWNHRQVTIASQPLFVSS